jgi:cell division protein FtsQ
MLPNARRQAARARLGWPFGRRRNRRVRAAAPAVPREPKPPLWRRAGAALASWRRGFIVAGVGVALAASAWGARWYLTHARHFAVRAVRVSATAHVAAEAIVARAGVPLGVNLFGVNRDEVARAVSQEPWIARAHVRRELPSTLVIDVVEREPACTVALGAVYLADADGNVFKRATPDEATALPVVTGLQREDYVAEPEKTRAQIRQALQALAAWRAGGTRPPLGEIHIDRVAGITLYTERGVGVRVGAVDGTLPARLARYDTVAADLDANGAEARLLYVDNRARPDRVTVKLAANSIQKFAPPQNAAHSGN